MRRAGRAIACIGFAHGVAEHICRAPLCHGMIDMSGNKGFACESLV